MKSYLILSLFFTFANYKLIICYEQRQIFQVSEYNYTAYQPSVLCTPQSPIIAPKDINEVRRIIREAVKNGTTVKAIGHHRGSRTDVICTQGIPLETINFKKIEINDRNKRFMTVKVDTGVTIVELLEALHKSGYSLQVTPTFGGMTVGGGIAVSFHGSTLKNPGSISDLLVQMTIVDGKGKRRRIDDPEELKAFKTHLGLLGFVVDVTLRIVRNYKISIENKLQPESILTNGTAMKKARNLDYFQMYWFPSSNDVVTSEGTYVNKNTSGEVKNTVFPKLSLKTTAVLGFLFERAQSTLNLELLNQLSEYTKASWHQKVQGREPILTEDGENLKNPGVGWAKDVLTSVCGTSCRWDYGNASLYDSWDEIAISVDNFEPAVKKLKEIFAHYNSKFPLFGVFIRFAKASDGYMSMANGRDTVFFEITTPMRDDRFNTSRTYLESFQALVQCLVKEFDGRPHWAKNGLFYHSTKYIEQNEQLDLFKNVMNKYDPNGTFMNYFGLRLMGKSNLTNVDPRVTHCSIEQHCECEKNSDCTKERECQTDNFGYKVCKPI